MTTTATSLAAAPTKNAKKPKSKRAMRKPVHIAAPKMKSRRKARQVTTEFHRLTHELDNVTRDKALDGEAKKRRVVELRAAIDAIGGRSAYQDASILSTSFHRTSKWVFQTLTRLDRRPKSKAPPLRVLEVGAINTQLLSCPWLDVRAIDLNSKHDRIEQCDFFTLRPNAEFEVIVSSMVLNCVPDPESRGRMLRLYYEHLQPRGLLFLMLPLLCLRNSKYMTIKRFVAILEAVGFVIRDTKDSPKVSFFCLEKDPDVRTPDANARFAHELLVPGPKRNDFGVALS